MTTTTAISSIRAADSGEFSPSSRLQASQRSFAAAMGRAQTAAGATDEDRALDAAEQLVTQTFISPILKQLRESVDAAPPFAPNQAEKQLRALTDAELAQRIVHASRFPLVDVLARNLLKKAGKDKAGRSAADELSAARTPTPGRPAQK